MIFYKGRAELLVNAMAFDDVPRTLPVDEPIDKACRFINKLALRTQKRTVYVHEKLPSELTVDVVAKICRGK